MDFLYTIGHSQHTVEHFVEMLRKYDINYVLDVRSIPYSKHAEQYNKEYISRYLKKMGIMYSFMGEYFGARPVDITLYSNEGYLDFNKVISSEKFRKGLANVELGLNKGNKIALMCTEKDPIDCHRAIMVSRGFELNGVNAQHIMPNGALQSQKELGRRLMNRYFPDRDQMSLFMLDGDKTEDDYLFRAYCKRNAEIGYRIKHREAMLV